MRRHRNSPWLARSNPNRKKRTDREHNEQVTVIEWVNWHLNRYPGLDLLYAIPNGGHRHPAVAAKLKAEGARAGVPDLALPVARRGAHGLYIEMKVPGGQESKNQKWWRTRLVEEGYRSVVCVGHEQAIAELKHYLS